MNSDLCERKRDNSPPSILQKIKSTVEHNHQLHADRTAILLGLAIVLVPIGIALSKITHVMGAVMIASVVLETIAFLQILCPCGCGKRTRELLPVTPCKESRRLLQEESGKSIALVVAVYSFLFGCIFLPVPSFVILGVMNLAMLAVGGLFIYIGVTERGHRFLQRPYLLRYQDLTARDFADYSDKELAGLMKYGIMIGALDGAELVSKFVLKKTELMYLSDSERNSKPLPSEAAPEADQASAA